MYHTQLKNILLSIVLLLSLSTFASAANEPLLKPGYAVHTFGVSPDAGNGDGNATLRIYKITGHGYAGDRPTADFANTITKDDWTIDKIGNVYGIAIDKDRNIYTTASANWSPGYVGTGNSGKNNVSVKYGSIENGADNNDSAGRIYRIDAVTGHSTVLATLPQTEITITNEVCQGTGSSVSRNAGAGLGNVAYDKIHNQLFVSNFSDGKIYRLNLNGKKLGEFDTGLLGVSADGKKVQAAYGLVVSPDGTKLYYGTMETNYKPQLFAVTLSENGNLIGDPIDQSIKLNDTLSYTQNIGGGAIDSGVWAAFSDIDFTPDGELLLGVRVGCNNNFATSYNHGGAVYLLKRDGNGWDASDKTNTDHASTDYAQAPNGNIDAGNRAGYYDGSYKYDAGAISLHPHDELHLSQETLEYGPDDGYGGVAVWQTSDGKYDIFATSSDISSRGGVHGFMQFSGDFNISNYATIKKVVGYRAVSSSTDSVVSNDELRYDYKGIGGDVEVLSVLPVSIGSYVWIDTNKDGLQDATDVCLDEANVTLHRADDMNAKVNDLNGGEVVMQQTHDCGQYHFNNLPEGNYRVCIVPPGDTTTIHYAPTIDQNGISNNDNELDSNIKEKRGNEYCSGTFGVYANSEPKEANTARGDNGDAAHDTWGNMTVDFGFVQQTFDLALIKELVGDPSHKYAVDESVTFKITVRNQGDVNATEVVIQDTLPVGLKLDDTRWNDDGTLKTPIALIEPGQEASVEIKCVVTDAVGQQGSLINVAEIASATNPYDLNDTDSIPGNNICGNDMSNNNNYDGSTLQGCDDVDPAQIIIEQHFDLALVKVVKGTKAKYKRGEKVTFIIAVKNQGTIDAKNVIIKDTIPAGLILDDERWNADGTLKTAISLIKPNEIVKREIVFRIASDVDNNTKITNIAEIEQASNDLNLPDDDSEPGTNPCGADMDHNNDISSPDANADGCDDVDPAWISITVPVVASDTYTPTPEPTPEAPADTVEDCDCDHVESNKADSMNLLVVLLMLMSTFMVVRFHTEKKEVA